MPRLRTANLYRFSQVLFLVVVFYLVWRHLDDLTTSKAGGTVSYPPWDNFSGKCRQKLSGIRGLRTIIDTDVKQTIPLRELHRQLRAMQHPARPLRLSKRTVSRPLKRPRL